MTGRWADNGPSGNGRIGDGRIGDETGGPDWRRFFRLYVRAGFAPEGFWSLTPPEFYLAMTPERNAPPPLDRAGMQALAALFPDDGRNEKHERDHS